MSYPGIESWLRDHSGLEASSLGGDAVTRRVAQRLAAIGCEDEGAYLTLLKTSTEERRWLIDEVVVPETWFFRDTGAFTAVTRYATEEWSPGNEHRKLRILCVPCSTGEESASIAITFAKLGWNAQRVSIEAVDISGTHIARAQHGVYRRNSFRGDDLSYRDTFFEPLMEDHWRLKDRIRPMLNYTEGNLLAEDFSFGRGSYDIIFCRNLLIYFNRETQERAIEALDKLLAPSGRMVAGPAEPILFFSHGYTPVDVRGAFMLRKGVKRSEPIRVASPPIIRQRPRRVISAPKSPPAKLRKSAPVIPTVTLDQVERLANSGKLREAMEQGTILLRSGKTPKLMHLLGVIADASGDARAAQEYYRKALYIDPKHQESLEQVALHMEKSGDPVRAKIWRERANRSSRGQPI